MKRPVGTIDQFHFVRAAVASAAPFSDLEERDAARFLVHLLTSARREGDGFVPVPSTLAQRHFRHLDWRALEEAGLIGVKPYSRRSQRCREFRVSAETRLAFYEAGPTAERVFRDGLYDLASGRPTTARTKSQRRTRSGNALPTLVRAAIDAVGDVPFNAHAIEAHLDRLRAIAAATEGEGRVAAEARLLNDLRCYHAVLAQGARPLDPSKPGGLWVYQPAYRPQRFGRVSQVGGGLQSCSKRMKRLAYPTTLPPSL